MIFKSYVLSDFVPFVDHDKASEGSYEEHEGRWRTSQHEKR